MRPRREAVRGGQPLATSLGAWLDRRVADVAAREGVNSLTTVGPNKPLGSCGYPNKEAAAAALDALPAVRDAAGRQRQIRFLAWDEPHGCWVYLYDVQALGTLLAVARQIEGLLPLGARQDSEAFVKFVRGHGKGSTVPPRTPLFDLVADAYGDRTNPGRTDCRFDPATCLRLYRERTGELDPVTVYFATNGTGEVQKVAQKLIRFYMRAVDPLADPLKPPFPKKRR